MALKCFYNLLVLTSVEQHSVQMDLEGEALQRPAKLGEISSCPAGDSVSVSWGILPLTFPGRCCRRKLPAPAPVPVVSVLATGQARLGQLRQHLWIHVDGNYCKPKSHAVRCASCLQRFHIPLKKTLDCGRTKGLQQQHHRLHLVTHELRWAKTSQKFTEGWSSAREGGREANARRP